MIDSQYFKLFACCIPVKGASRSTICDIQRGKFEFIPNILYEILIKHETKSIEEVKRNYKNKYDDIIDEYYDFLINKEYGFTCSDKEELKKFPKINLDWITPVEITNAIIDLDSNSDYDISIVANDLNSLGCKALEIRIFETFTLRNIEKIVSNFEDSRITNIVVLTKFNKEYSYDANTLIEFLQKNPRVTCFIFHSSPKDETLVLENVPIPVILRTNAFSSSDCCGNIKPEYFTVNIEMFTESQTYNSCLNRKIGVDARGNIKNCPSSIESYGTIQNGRRLINAVLDSNFKNLWHLNKDQIEVCKDCEFRYICTDCRIFLENKNNLYSKPLKCNYNPYTSTWES